MKILYDASANFDIEGIELEVPDEASKEDMIRAMLEDLMDRYNLLYTIYEPNFRNNDEQEKMYENLCCREAEWKDHDAGERVGENWGDY